MSDWENFEKSWDERATLAEKEHPIKRLKILPQMPGIAPGENKHLKWKSFKYILFHREGLKIFKHIMKKPLQNGFFYLKSLFKKKSYKREGDFFLYGFSSLDEFSSLLETDVKLVIGFSYCQKPFECPSKRFTPDCIRDINHPVCQQCDIGKVLHALPAEKTIPLIIPTVHYIGEKMFELRKKYKNIIYLITACEMTLEMFGDFGNMLNIKGIGIRLDGRICNTMKAFVLSEEGVKPGLTVVLPDTQRKILYLIRKRVDISKCQKK